MSETNNHDELISQFTDITGATTDRATFYLESVNWSLEVNILMAQTKILDLFCFFYKIIAIFRARSEAFLETMRLQSMMLKQLVMTILRVLHRYLLFNRQSQQKRKNQNLKLHQLVLVL